MIIQISLPDGETKKLYLSHDDVLWNDEFLILKVEGSRLYELVEGSEWQEITHGN